MGNQANYSRWEGTNSTPIKQSMNTIHEHISECDFVIFESEISSDNSTLGAKIGVGVMPCYMLHNSTIHML
jgi:hypothetical protein